MADDRIVILGAAGMLGSDLSAACQRHQLDAKGFDLPDFDITSDRQLAEALEGAKTVINCAAYTNVDKAESEPGLAYKVNAEAAGRLGQLAKKADMWVMHISTDFVFDGRGAKPYTETDKPNPINEYGRSKLAGEQLLIESRCRHCIMRIEWTYGLGGNNFVTRLVSLAQQGKKLRVVDDQIGAPTATTEVAEVICTLVRKRPEGLFHFANAGYVSRVEMAKFIFDKLNITVDLSRCKSGDYKAPAKRPLNSRFDCSKIKTLLDEPIKPWQEPLERFLRQL